MEATLLVHIAAGGVGLVAGYLALFAAKGAPLHRRAGLAFVAAMLPMSGAGLVVTVGRSVALATNVPAGLLTAYLVVTALTTVRPATAATRRLDRAGTGVALAVGLVSLWFGAEAIAAGGTRDGMPAFPFLMFAAVGLAAGAGDVREAAARAAPDGSSPAPPTGSAPRSRWPAGAG